MNKFYKLVLMSVLALTSTFAFGGEPLVLPKPTQMTVGTGAFTLQNGASIGYNCRLAKDAASFLTQILSPSTGYTFNLKKGQGDITFILKNPKQKSGDEAYTLVSNGQGITIEAASYRGLVHGISSLRQLLPAAVEKKCVQTGVAWTVPAVSIQDKPCFEWRGLMLDPVRHFYSVEETKRFLDVMSLYKFSKFHWHITDSQAWRWEVKKYPLLTEKGAWRDPTQLNIDKGCEERATRLNNPTMHLPKQYMRQVDGKTLYGGYYTREDIREVVEYAAVRGIDVVPEVDMPGHNRITTQCYPWLGCAGDGTDPLCLGNDKVIKFCKDVYKELFKLFPYGFAEIGGDEVNRKKWDACEHCQARIKKEGLKDVTELQSWFTRDMEKFFNKHGRRLIGWDEILEGGVSKTATVNWWRGHHADVVQKSTDGGNEVILCPTTFCYFDYSQDSTTLQKLYEGAVVPEGLTPQQLKLIKGMQANIWCEYIPSEARMQYMVFPRALALAEKAWTPKSDQSWEGYMQRLKPQLERLKLMGVNYRPLNAEFTPGLNTILNF